MRNLAAQQGNLPIVRALVAAGVNVDAVDKQGQKAVDYG
jgi:ankyrin repeat protein